MKRFIACVCLLSSITAFGYELNAVDAVLSVLPVGIYQGKNDLDIDCTVSVYTVNFPDNAIAVTVTDNKTRLFKVVNANSEFRFRAYKSEFIQTERFYVDANRNAYVDRILRTVDAGEGRLYVVVGHESTVNRDVRQETAECVVKVK